jgi:NADH:ubiquinone oxidoreductase subunit
MEYENTIRLSVFLGLFALLALAEVLIPRRARAQGRTRRWVIFNGPSEPSAIPSGWHGWMHHRTDVSPAAETYVAKAWEQAHEANMTGTARAYRPKGSILNQGARPHVTGDYDAWTPKS